MAETRMVRHGMATATEVTHSFSVPKDTTGINKYGQACVGEKVTTIQEPGNKHDRYQELMSGEACRYTIALPTFHLGIVNTKSDMGT